MKETILHINSRSLSNNQKIAVDVLQSAEEKAYSGYSKFDALNSPLLQQLTFNNKWLRFLYTQIIKESPVNLRALFRVETSKNPKGIALFARTYLILYEMTSDPKLLQKAEMLLEWLLDHPSPGLSKLCWGYNYVWQSTIFLQEKYEPNAVVTVFAGEALLHAYRITKKRKYLEAAFSAAEFIVHDLPVLHDTKDERAIAYVLRKVDAVVLNNQVLTGAFLAKVWQHNRNVALLDIARRQMSYTVNRRTDYYAWYYTYPMGKSPIRHDNYHTGGILDGLLEYQESTGDHQFADIYWKGLEYYKKNLFESNGAPRWMNDKRYPFDVHGAAQGIVSFVKASRYDNTFLEQAEKIAAWTLKNFYRPKTKDFVYRIGRWYKWNYSLMRWCNAWMVRALAELAYEENRGA